MKKILDKGELQTKWKGKENENRNIKQDSIERT